VLYLVSSFTFPFIRSNKIEFYFSVPVRSMLGLRTRHGNGNGATERQCGHGLRKRLRMNGNVMLETWHYYPAPTTTTSRIRHRLNRLSGKGAYDTSPRGLV